MANASLWIPTAIYKLPKQVKVGAGKGDTTLTDALSGIVLAPAQELCSTCISFSEPRVLVYT